MNIHRTALALIAAACLLGAPLTITQSAYALPKPRIKVSAALDRVVLTAAHKKRKIRVRKSVLVVQTAIDGGGFIEIARFHGKRRNNLTFYAGSTGVYTFRARSIDHRGKSSSWTAPRSVLVVVPDDSEPPPPAPEQQDPPQIPWPQLSTGLSECPDGLIEGVLNGVNARRIAAGVKPLSRRYELQVAARNHSIWMAENKLMVHDGWFEEIRETNLQASHFSQNIARYISDPERLVEAWMSSASHAKNILNPKDSMTGISCIAAVDGEYYWTQDFAG